MMDETQTPVDTTQQVTSKVPTTHVKNPNRVKAGKAIAEKRRLAKESQKQKMAEAETIIAKENLRKAQEEAKKVDPPETAPQETVSQNLTTTQLLSVISIGLSLIGLYYKHEEIKNALSKFKAPASANASANTSANAQTAPASALPAPAPPPVDKTPKKGGIRSMA